MGIKHRADSGFRKFSGSQQALSRWTSTQLRNALRFIPENVVNKFEMKYIKKIIFFVLIVITIVIISAWIILKIEVRQTSYLKI